MENKSICKKEYCTACYACINACPKACITMQSENNDIYPVIDEKACINCGACERVCPVYNRVELAKPIKAYAGVSKDEKTNILSASGGITAEIAKHFISNGGIVYGSAMQNDLSAKCIRCESLDDLAKIQGSKYVHSKIEKEYTNAKSDLENGKDVLFISTPCQIAGLKNFLRKDYSNLYTIDLICHGVPSSEMFLDCSKNELKGDFSKAKNVSFRDKNNYVLKYFDENGELIKTIDNKCSTYLTAFLDSICQRECCFNCLYANDKRIGDITLGDYREIGANKPIDFENKYGVNAILVNSNKGSEILEMISGSIKLNEREINSIVSGNTQLQAPIKNSDEAKKYRALLKTTSPTNALKSYNKKKHIFISFRKFVYKHKLLLKLFKALPILKERI